MKFWLSNEDETRRAGAALAAVLLPLASSAPVVVFVRGNLGAGKSTFVRGFLARAGVTGVMPSPTYSLVEPYQTDTLNVFHMDAYRLADGAELDYLGLDDIEQPGSILLVEWPDHVRDELPAPTATVDLEMSSHPDKHKTAQGQPGQNQDSGHDTRDHDTRDRHNPGDTLDRHNSDILDRHNSAKTLDHGAAPNNRSSDSGQAEQAKGRHNSAKSVDQGFTKDRHQSATGRAKDRHSSDCGQADHAKDAHLAGFNTKTGRERQTALEVGRLLNVTLGAVPVQVEQRMTSSEDWHGLFRVVT